MNWTDEHERSAEAGEYVLGTLGEAERAGFEQRLMGDRALQAEVYAWQDRLLALNSRVKPLPVRRDLLARLLHQVGMLSPRAANDPWWQAATPWRWGTGLGLAATVLLTSVMLWRPTPIATEPVRTISEMP
jgi:anti-sigma-K factor RskA